MGVLSTVGLGALPAGGCRSTM